MGGGSLTQAALAVEGEIAVRGVVIDRPSRHVEGNPRRPQIGVEILEPQHVGVVGCIGGISHDVDSDTGDGLQARHGHGGSRFVP
ncbi:hypothetical protein [Streptomyces sp. NPDC014685]|uniref:hypothetical protein n=1 Tax=Streptomyces sp. NPDC014685 TaxID=3364881 RepID=UPI0036F6784E